MAATGSAKTLLVDDELWAGGDEGGEKRKRWTGEDMSKSWARTGLEDFVKECVERCEYVVS